MLHYDIKYEDEKGYIYSCDMMRFKLEFKREEIEDITLRFSNYNRLDVTTYPINLSSFKYRQMLTVEYQFSKLTLGMGFNGVSADSKFEGFVEFNPNKCLKSALCLEDLKFIFSRCWSIDLLRWDLAIDLPVARHLVKLSKDKRKYTVVRSSSEDVTEYLGQMSSIGRIKVYNKKVESKLLNDLTRVELTLPDMMSADDISQYFPTVWVQRFHSEMIFETNVLNDTDRVLVELLQNCENPDYYLKRLGRGKREKLQSYVYQDCEKLHYSIPLMYRLYNDYRQKLGLSNY